MIKYLLSNKWGDNQVYIVSTRVYISWNMNSLNISSFNNCFNVKCFNINCLNMKTV